jgi:hypothetical protein
LRSSDDNIELQSLGRVFGTSQRLFVHMSVNKSPKRLSRCGAYIRHESRQTSVAVAKLQNIKVAKTEMPTDCHVGSWGVNKRQMSFIALPFTVIAKRKVAKQQISKTVTRWKRRHCSDFQLIGRRNLIVIAFYRIILVCQRRVCRDVFAISSARTFQQRQHFRQSFPAALITKRQTVKHKFSNFFATSRLRKVFQFISIYC